MMSRQLIYVSFSQWSYSMFLATSSAWRAEERWSKGLLISQRFFIRYIVHMLDNDTMT